MITLADCVEEQRRRRPRGERIWLVFGGIALGLLLWVWLIALD